MTPNDFFAYASKLFLSFPASPANYRSVTSRAYYGAYHCARRLVEIELGVRCKSGISEHLYLQRLLKESHVDEAVELGQSLDNLHNNRKEADYDLEREQPERKGQAQLCLERALEIISLVNRCSADEGLRLRIKQGIEDYKKKVNDLP